MKQALVRYLWSEMAWARDTRRPEQGAATTVYCAAHPDAEEVSAKRQRCDSEMDTNVVLGYFARVDSRPSETRGRRGRDERKCQNQRNIRERK